MGSGLRTGQSLSSKSSLEPHDFLPLGAILATLYIFLMFYLKKKIKEENDKNPQQWYDANGVLKMFTVTANALQVRTADLRT